MSDLDYRPYLLATDLRTPEDVLAWLRAEYLDRYHDVHEAAEELAYRLDHARRQACRRGALDYWRLMCECEAFIRENPLDAIGARENLVTYKARAIAFRAAARQQ